MHALAENGTWDLVDAPKGVKPIGCRWVYKASKHDIEYDETFAPVAKMKFVRVLLAVAAAKGRRLHQTDVKNAFLQGELEEQVYMVQPPGFHSGTNTSVVCRLKKFLYGLKRRSRGNCVGWSLRRRSRTLHYSSGKLDSDRLLFYYMLMTWSSPMPTWVK